MAILNELISNIFEEFNYSNCHKSGAVRFFHHNEVEDYWIILNLSCFPDDTLIDYSLVSENIFKEFKAAYKNTSMLILWRVDGNGSDVWQRVIEIENDPYDYKKYVVVYTDEDIAELKKLEIDNLASFLLLPETFSNLKNEKTGHGIGVYHLLYSISHKLPFMSTSYGLRNVQILQNGFVPAEKSKDIYEWLKEIEIDNVETMIEKEINNETV